jgi:hypothetical protein
MSGRPTCWRRRRSTLRTTCGAAAEYIRDIAKPGALSIYRLKIEANRNENRQTKDYSSIADEIDKRVRGKTKSSKMRGTLVDDFGEQEGRDPSEDVLMDDFGNQTSGAVAPHGYQGRTFGDISYEVPATAPTGVQVSYGQDLARRAPPQWPTTPEPAVKTPAEMRATYEATKREDKTCLDRADCRHLAQAGCERGPSLCNYAHH